MSEIATEHSGSSTEKANEAEEAMLRSLSPDQVRLVSEFLREEIVLRAAEQPSRDRVVRETLGYIANRLESLSETLATREPCAEAQPFSLGFMASEAEMLALRDYLHTLGLEWASEAGAAEAALVESGLEKIRGAIDRHNLNQDF